MLKQITDALIPVLVTLALGMLPPLIAHAIAWARAKANETKIGSQSKIDDLFFDELEGSVAGLMETAKAWKAGNNGTLTDVQKQQLNQMAIDQATANLAQHGKDFVKKLPIAAADDWVKWHVMGLKPMSQGPPQPPLATKP